MAAFVRLFLSAVLRSVVLSATVGVANTSYGAPVARQQAPAQTPAPTNTPQPPADTNTVPPQSPATVQALTTAGLAAQNAGRISDALTLYRQALEVARATNNASGEANSLANIGFGYNKISDYPRALKHHEQALVLFQLTGNKIGEANSLRNIATVYSNLNQPLKEVEYYEQALPLYREIGNKAGEANALNNLGWAYKRLGNFPKALEFLGLALPAYQQTGIRSSEANTLKNIGYTYDAMQQYPKALEYYEQALTLYRQIGNKTGEASTLQTIGQYYYYLGQSQKAADFYEQAIPLFQQNGVKSGEAQTWLLLGIVRFDLSQNEKAIECNKQAFLLSRQSGVVSIEAEALINLGLHRRQLGQYAKALEYMEQAAAFGRQAGSKNLEAIALLNTGLAYHDLNQFPKALENLERSLLLFRGTGNTQWEAATLEWLGMVYQSSGRLPLAEARLRQAIVIHEQTRVATGSDGQTRASYLANFVGLYQRLTSVLLAQHTSAKNHEAFAIVQQMKGRALLDLLAGRATLDKQLTPAESAKLSEMRKAGDTLNARIVAEGVTNEVGSRKRTEALQTELEKAERDLSTYTELLYAKYPDTAASRAAQTADAEQVSRSLPPGTAVVEFASCSSYNDWSLVAFVVTPSKTGAVSKAYPVALTWKELRKLVTDLRAGVVDPRKAGGNGWKTPARALYNALLAPAQKDGQFRGISRLVLCPNGLLWDVPFATLLNKDNQSLLSRFTLSQAASASVYLATQNRAMRQARERNASATLRFLAVADPAFAEYKQGFGNDPALPGQRPLPTPDRPLPSPDRPLPSPDRPLPVADRALLPPEAMRGGKLASLPGTRREAKAIHAAFPGATVLTGADAQEGTIKTLAPQCRFLHLATHGFANNAAPLLSAVVLAEPPKDGPGSSEDGFLTARELLDMDLSHVELVTLSACNTARGQNQDGEGMVGLTWSLFAAGCPTQVLSQWAVNDQSTATLMEQFYANLKAGNPKAEALRQAALFVSKRPQTAHPYYWAPFVLFGAGK